MDSLDPEGKVPFSYQVRRRLLFPARLPEKLPLLAPSKVRPPYQLLSYPSFPMPQHSVCVHTTWLRERARFVVCSTNVSTAHVPRLLHLRPQVLKDPKKGDPGWPRLQVRHRMHRRMSHKKRAHACIVPCTLLMLDSNWERCRG